MSLLYLSLACDKIIYVSRKHAGHPEEITIVTIWCMGSKEDLKIANIIIKVLKVLKESATACTNILSNAWAILVKRCLQKRRGTANPKADR